MKLKSIFLSLLLIPTFLFSQSKSSIDIVGSADFSYRHLTAGDENATSLISNQELVDFLNGRQMGRFKARFGFNYNRQISQKIFLKTGLRLANVGYINEFRVSGFSPEDTRLSNEHLFVEVPIVIRYEAPQDEKITLFLEAGFSPHIYLSTKTQDVDTGEITEEPMDFAEEGFFNRLHWVGSFSAGLNYNLNNKWQLFGQPVFRYHFTSLNDLSELSAPLPFTIERLYTIGFEFGVRRFL